MRSVLDQHRSALSYVWRIHQRGSHHIERAKLSHALQVRRKGPIPGRHIERLEGIVGAIERSEFERFGDDFRLDLPLDRLLDILLLKDLKRTTRLGFFMNWSALP